MAVSYSLAKFENWHGCPMKGSSTTTFTQQGDYQEVEGEDRGRGSEVRVSTMCWERGLSNVKTAMVVISCRNAWANNSINCYFA